MNKTETNIFKKFYNWFLTVDLYKNNKDDSDNKYYLNFLFKSLFISLSLFLSFVLPSLNILPVIVCMVTIFSERPENGLYYFAFITLFWFVFDYSLIVYGVIFLRWGIKYLKDILNKNINFNWKALLLAAVPILYVLLPIGSTRFDYILFTATASITLFFVFTYRHNYNLKKFSIISTIAILSSAAIGFIGLIFRDIYDFEVAFYYYKHLIRFNACYINCNFFAVFVFTSLAVLTFLYLRKEINLFYKIIFPIYTIFIILTGSKLACMFYFIIFLYLIFALTFSKQGKKHKLIDIIYFTIMFGLVCLIFKDFIAMMINRFSIKNSDYYLSDQVGDQEYNRRETLSFITRIINSKFGKTLSSITTYRSDVWLLYINELLLYPLHLLFGKGEGAERLIVMNSEGLIIGDPHNSIIDLVFYLGLAFLAFLIVLLTLFVKYRKKEGARFNKSSIIVLLSCFFASCTISVFWSYMFIFLLLNSMLAMFDVKTEKGEKNEGSSNK